MRLHPKMVRFARPGIAVGAILCLLAGGVTPTLAGPPRRSKAAPRTAAASAALNGAAEDLDSSLTALRPSSEGNLGYPSGSGAAGSQAKAGNGSGVGEYRAGSVRVSVTNSEVMVRNSLSERGWSRSPFMTTSILDRRGHDRVAGVSHRDFSLTLGGLEIGSDSFVASSVAVEQVPSGLRVRMGLDLSGAEAAGVLKVERIVEAYGGVAGFRTQTVLHSTVPLALNRASLEEVATGPAVPTIHAFRAGADWREPGWTGPQLAIGDPHAGTWRETRTAGVGESVEGPAQWVSAANGERSAFLVLERNDLPSSRAAYDGSVARVSVDYAWDVLDLGPFEEQGHVENPAGQAGRFRLVLPGRPFPLEPVFVGLGNGDGDEAWQFHQYLTGHQQGNYEHGLVFNSNGTDQDRISTGAKDDLDYATILNVAPVARRLGVETFVLDDGWQAISGDWDPDSPAHPEPRWDGVPGSKFAPRFPDDSFGAVRQAIAPMKLGLWMSPLHFNPNSQTYQQHPDWACAPVGHGLALYNAFQPDSSSNEAGIGQWSAAALPWVESRIRRAIEQWGVTYFKFDFLAWLDCAGQGDFYDLHDAFVAMLDRLGADYPQVTFQIDETNDYRLFPFESVSRGPTWFQNGTPEPRSLLHNLWNLSPWVPASAIGQHVLGGGVYQRYPVGTLMAASLLSHATFFSDLRSLPPEVIDAARPWVDFAKTHRDLLDGVVYPLLEDPLAGGWTAFQSWDPEAGRGALLAFRQDDGRSSVSVALRNVPRGLVFDLLEAPTGRTVGRATSEELRQGLRLDIGQTGGAKVLLIVPAR